MQTTEKRIAALENSASDKSLKVVAVYLSELDERI